MTEGLSAKERKRAAAKPKLSGRRAGRMTTYVDHSIKVKRRKSEVHPSFFERGLRTPSGLSAEARFMELRPEGFSTLDWFRLFDPDEEMWEALAEEAIWEMTNGLAG